MQLTQSFFASNRQHLIERINRKGIIVIPGNGRMQRNADNPFPFRQDSNLFYLTGINEPCATLVIDTIHNQQWVMLPLRSGVQAIFDGTTNTDELLAISGVDEIIDEQVGWQRLRLLATNQLFVPIKPPVSVQETYTNPHRARVLQKLRRLAVKSPVEISHDLALLRAIKSEVEIALLNQAARITLTAIDAVKKQLSDFTTEYQIEAELTKQFRFAGASGHAFTPIVAAGNASCTLHYQANSGSLKGGIVLLDIGAEVANYSADISRTLALQDATQRQKDIITAVLAAQSAIINNIKPGLSWQELSLMADTAVANALVDLKLLPKAYSGKQLRSFFPHAVSHFLGLDTHDVGDYTKPLQAGMVITIEPGIYVANEATGVRVEDDIVITKNGAKKLGFTD